MHEPRSDEARVDLGNLSHAEITTAKLLHQQGVAWPIACLYVAWRRTFPNTHVGQKGSALLAEAAAAGRAKRKART